MKRTSPSLAKSQLLDIIWKVVLPAGLLIIGQLLQFWPKAWGGVEFSKEQAFLFSMTLMLSGIWFDFFVTLIQHGDRRDKLLSDLSAGLRHADSDLDALQGAVRSIESQLLFSESLRHIGEASADRPGVLHVRAEQLLQAAASDVKEISTTLRVEQEDKHHLYRAPCMDFLYERNGTFEDIWIVDGIDALTLQEDDLQWFTALEDCILRASRDGKSVSRKTVFVLTIDVEKVDDELWRALRNIKLLFDSRDGYAARFVTRECYESCLKAANCSQHVDYGLYDRRAAFLTMNYDGPKPKGYWTLDDGTIRKLSHHFDLVWKSMRGKVEEGLGAVGPTLESDVVMKSLCAGARPLALEAKGKME